MSKPVKHVFVCGQQRPDGHPRGSCGAVGASSVAQSFAAVLTARNLFSSIALTNSGCLGPCHLGANVLVYPEGILYSEVKPEDVETIVEQHLIQGQPVTAKLAPAEVWS
ncbi:MAG: (2Fe-2S) ferredoxin domain-containing protein [Pseudomonadales bacterium]|nr:(2Fe-2S) ferredoxin domain-containing protein [Pseudomonadales bacterium]